MRAPAVTSTSSICVAAASSAIPTARPPACARCGRPGRRPQLADLGFHLILYPLTGSPLASHHTVVQFIHWANPLSPGIEAIRAPLFAGKLPHWTDALYLAVACAVALLAGALVFRRVDDQIAIEV